MTRPGLLFYCQHSVGMGHLVRSLTLAEALSDRFDVVLLSGGAVPPEVVMPPAVRVVPLPPLGHDDGYELVSRDPHRPVEEVKRARARRILSELRSVRPAVVIVELYPFGRRKFAFELLPLLEASRTLSPRPLVLSSVRDILVASPTRPSPPRRAGERGGQPVVRRCPRACRSTVRPAGGVVRTPDAAHGAGALHRVRRPAPGRRRGGADQHRGGRPDLRLGRRWPRGRPVVPRRGRGRSGGARRARGADHHHRRPVAAGGGADRARAGRRRGRRLLGGRVRRRTWPPRWPPRRCR